MTTPATNSGVSRREMLGTVARWTVPTVVTMTLGARVLEAKASCPACQRRVGATCRACTISQMLNCQCEPCLGPPYCAAVGPVAPAIPGNQSSVQTPGGQPLTRQPAPGGQNNPPGGLTPNQQMQYERERRARNPFSEPLYRDPFGADRRQNQPTGLYERLRPDTTRRRP